MAWFDYLTNIGQGLGQGVSQYQRQQQQRVENTRQRQLLELQQAQNQRAEEEAAAAEFERLLSGVEGEVDPALLAELTQPRFAKYAKGALTKTPEGKIARRKTLAQQTAELNFATAQANQGEADILRAARQKIRQLGKNVYALPLEDRESLARDADYDPERLMTQGEKTKMARELAMNSPSVISTNIMAGIRSQGNATTQQEALAKAQDDMVAEMRVDPRLAMELSQNPALREQWMMNRAQLYLTGGRGGAVAPMGGMPSGYVLVGEQ